MKTDKIFFLVSLALAIICILAQFINLYRYSFVGAIAEIIWLPVLAGLAVLPVLAFLNWRKEKFVWRSFNLLSILVVAASVTVVITLN